MSGTVSRDGEYAMAFNEDIIESKGARRGYVPDIYWSTPQPGNNKIEGMRRCRWE